MREFHFSKPRNLYSFGTLNRETPSSIILWSTGHSPVKIFSKFHLFNDQLFVCVSLCACVFQAKTTKTDEATTKPLNKNRSAAFSLTLWVSFYSFESRLSWTTVMHISIYLFSLLSVQSNICKKRTSFTHACNDCQFGLRESARCVNWKVLSPFNNVHLCLLSFFFGHGKITL